MVHSPSSCAQTGIFFHINIGNHNIADIDLILLQAFITPKNSTPLYSQNLCISQKLLCAPRTRFNSLLYFPRMKPQDSSSRCFGAVTVAVDRSASDFACGTSEDVKTKCEGILQKGPIRHAYAWQIGPFWQDTLELRNDF